jgi:hypothetical protein
MVEMHGNTTTSGSKVTLAAIEDWGIDTDGYSPPAI